MIETILGTSLSFLLFCTGVYVLTRAAAIPYEVRTDRLWKLGETEFEPDEPSKEELTLVPHEVIDLQSRKTVS